MPGRERPPPRRLVAAVDALQLRGGESVLEVGCGAGVALALIADRLTTGAALGIDRSATAVARARARNADTIAAGRVAVEHVDLATFRPAARTFDVALAVDVNVFWTGEATAELAALDRLVAPGGRVLLAYDAPHPERAVEAARRAAAGFVARGWGTALRNLDDPAVALLAAFR